VKWLFWLFGMWWRLRSRTVDNLTRVSTTVGGHVDKEVYIGCVHWRRLLRFIDYSAVTILSEKSAETKRPKSTTALALVQNLLAPPALG
jgi:hypothetical protein